MAACSGKEEQTPVQADSLQIAVARIDSIQWPVDLPDSCRADSGWIVNADSVLNLRITLSEDYVDSASLASDPGIQHFVISMLLTDNAMAEALESARMVPVSLSVIVTDNYGRNFSFGLPAAAFHNTFFTAPDVRHLDEVKVTNRVKADNSYCPFEIEDGVTLQSMLIQDRYVTFRTLIDAEKLDFPVMKENRDSVNRAVVESLRMQLNDPEQEKSLREIAAARLGYRNRYIASDATDSFDISFTPEHIERIVFIADSMRKSVNSHNHK